MVSKKFVQKVLVVLEGSPREPPRNPLNFNFFEKSLGNPGPPKKSPPVPLFPEENHKTKRNKIGIILQKQKQKNNFKIHASFP